MTYAISDLTVLDLNLITPGTNRADFRTATKLKRELAKRIAAAKHKRQAEKESRDAMGGETAEEIAAEKAKYHINLHGFSAEIRLNIFERCVDLDHEHPLAQQPGLIEAFRSERDGILYAEAIECFYKFNTFTIRRENLPTWERLWKYKKVLNFMRSLFVVNLMEPIKYRVFEDFFSYENKAFITDITFASKDPQELLQRIITAFRLFPRLRHIRALTSTACNEPAQLIHSKKMHIAFDEISRQLGVKKRMYSVSVGVAEYWFWEGFGERKLKTMLNGKPMKWLKKLDKKANQL